MAISSKLFTCGDCCYSQRDDEASKENLANPIYQCCYNQPQAHVGTDHKGQLKIIGVRPPVNSHDVGCHHWLPKHMQAVS